MGRAFEFRKARKMKRWANMSKTFTKFGRQISMAVKQGGADLGNNSILRMIVQNAKGANMPKDRIDAAIKKASTVGEGDNYDEIRYEGYGSGGIAFVVEALTDNKNRTAGEVRSIFSKYGGSLGETGSVSFMFDHIGLIEYEGEVASEDEMFEIALESGAIEVESSKDWHSIFCSTDDFSVVRDKLIEKFGNPRTARFDWKPKDKIELGLEQAQKIMKVVDALEDCDDVQMVFGNYYIADDILEQLDN